MIKLVISGGQTGADQAGWRAAKRCGLPTGGWMPAGFKTEEGPRPHFESLYGAREHKSPDYPPRTRSNIEWADATLIFDTAFGGSMADFSKGTQLAMQTCMNLGKPNMAVATQLDRPPVLINPENYWNWVKEHNIRTLNVAGNRESTSEGIGEWAEEYLVAIFEAIKAGDAAEKAEETAKRKTEEDEFYLKQAAILARLPEEFRSAVACEAWDRGHSYGYNEVLSYTENLVGMIEVPLTEYTRRITGKATR